MTRYAFYTQNNEDAARVSFNRVGMLVEYGMPLKVFCITLRKEWAGPNFILNRLSSVFLERTTLDVVHLDEIKSQLSVLLGQAVEEILSGEATILWFKYLSVPHKVIFCAMHNSFSVVSGSGQSFAWDAKTDGAIDITEALNKRSPLSVATASVGSIPVSSQPVMYNSTWRTKAPRVLGEGRDTEVPNVDTPKGIVDGGEVLTPVQWEKEVVPPISFSHVAGDVIITTQLEHLSPEEQERMKEKIKKWKEDVERYSTLNVPVPQVLREATEKVCKDLGIPSRILTPENTVSCPDCEGKGRHPLTDGVSYECRVCRGTGRVNETTALFYERQQSAEMKWKKQWREMLAKIVLPVIKGVVEQPPVTEPRLSCCCGEPSKRGIVHRLSEPCYIDESSAASAAKEDQCPKDVHKPSGLRIGRCTLLRDHDGPCTA